MSTQSILMRSGFDRREAKAILDAITAGAGGGGGGGFAPEHQEAWTTALTLRTTGEGGVNDGAIVWNTLADPETSEEYPWCTVGAGADAGRLLLDAGWYDVRIIVAITFAAAAAVTYMRSAFTVGNAAVGNHEDWAGPVVDASGNKLIHRLVNLGTIYSDGTAKIQPQIRWNTGVYAASSAYMHASITKLA